MFICILSYDYALFGCVLNYECVVPDLESLNVKDTQKYYVTFDFVEHVASSIQNVPENPPTS